MLQQLIAYSVLLAAVSYAYFSLNLMSYVFRGRGLLSYGVK